MGDPIIYTEATDTWKLPAKENPPIRYIMRQGKPRQKRSKKMTAKEAIEILHPSTTAQTLLRIEYLGYGDAHGKRAAIKAVNDACLAACEVLEKQIPKKPRETRCALMCASCGHKITEKGCKKLHRNYCKKCGQKIDWED